MSRSGPLGPMFRESIRHNGAFWRKCAFKGATHGPEWWLRIAPVVTGVIIFLIVGKNRRAALTNMTRVLRNPGLVLKYRSAMRMFVDFALCMAETIEYYGPRPRSVTIDEPEDEDLSRALNEGRGAVVVTGHLGNWDIAAKALRHYGRKMNLVMAREGNPTIGSLAEDSREGGGLRIIRSDASPFSSLEMIKALRRNEIVAIQLDRSLAKDRTEKIPLFGYEAEFPIGPFVLASIAQAPIIPVFVPRLGRRSYQIRVGSRVQLEAGGHREPELLSNAMKKVVSELEEVISDHPTQWFQFQPFWPDDATEANQLPSRDQSAESASRVAEV